MRPFITIFTPTYNRGKLLISLHEKLCLQTCKDFIWLIIDDGSTDDTRDIIDELIKEGKIKIKYYFQTNKGKQQAFNTAIEKCDTECFAFCDSDDWYIESTIMNFKKNYEEVVKKNNNICGIVARRSDQNLNFKQFPKINFNRKVINLPVLYTKYKFHAETCAMFKTNTLKEAKYPNIDEKFIPESYMFDRLSQKYDVLFINEAYSITEYLEDGYTVQSSKLYHNNPLGVYYALREAVYTEYGFVKDIKNIASLLCWCKIYNIKPNFWKIKHLYKFPFSYLIYLSCIIKKKPDWIWENSNN